MSQSSSLRLRVSAVSYLNTSPLVWGMLHGPQRGVFDLRFELPAICAQSLEAGTADLGLVPVIEIERQRLTSVPGLGIASNGAVRSILLISKVPVEKIASVTMDASSRTSVALTRIILAEKYGIEPVESLEGESDATLLIGDPALRYNIEGSQRYVYDLGLEWRDLTGLPMVYAMWAGHLRDGVGEVLQSSYKYGRDRIDDIVNVEAAQRGFSAAGAREYLTRHIEYELREQHEAGMARFFELAGKHGVRDIKVEIKPPFDPASNPQSGD